jgi:glycosyltransferase involved in cell wall biosynthesis
LDSVSDEDLPGFYKNALCFCLPSLYEGFGLPILEAMQYGCPVATSNVSSLPEAGGDAVVYFDPENVEDITKALHSLVNDEELRNKLVKKGYEQIKKFSWEKTARETLRILEDVVKSD